MAGRIVHVEIPVDDSAAGQAFWGGLFGWEFESYPGMPGYDMTRTAEDQGAAISKEPGTRGLRAYFDVDDINAGAARVKELGGQADAPMPVPQMGWFATCTDPHGNEFGLWQTDPSAQAPEG
jgi:predicted enzyme related to lactoylglutathione lyase